MSSKVDASGKMAGLEFLLFSGTGKMLHIFDFENCAVVNFLEAELISA